VHDHVYKILRLILSDSVNNASNSYILGLQTITQPISALTRAVENVTAGKWEQKLPVSSNDELGSLTEAFNHMTSAVMCAEKKLASHVEFLQVLIDDIPIPVFYKDLDSIMIGCNHAYVNFWGKPKQDIIGEHSSHIYSEEDSLLHIRKDREMLEKQAPVSYEHSVVDAKGQTRQVIFNKAFYCDETGRPAGTIGVIQDVTEQRQADRMKSEFVSTVAHEFQTPLATILGYVELLQEGVLQQKGRDDALALIAKKTEALSEMVDELLDLARIEAGKGLMINLKPCNIGELLAEMVANFEKRTPSHQFFLKRPDQELFISADKVRIEQVVENLLSNAVKYSSPQSTITVNLVSDEHDCQVQIIDQGIGMTAQQQDKIFEKYYRVDSKDTAPAGTGLGLHITKSIVDAHNGKIDVDSAPGQGTTITFRIPVHNVGSGEVINAEASLSSSVNS
jgi:PAS domain S-box-containing protein